jgi:hypothetical protein
LKKSFRLTIFLTYARPQDRGQTVAEIVVQGGDTEAAAAELAVAVRDIFDVELIRRVGGGHTPGTRGPLEIAAVCLALPPAATAIVDIVARAQFGARLQRLIARVTTLRKTTRARVLIDLGDGKPIPLEEASREAIIAALRDVDQRLKR